MFAITGEWKGELVEDKLVSAQHLIEEYKIPFPNDKSTVLFELNLQNKTVASFKDGKYHVGYGRSVLCFIQGNVNGASVMLRYYKTKTLRANGKGFNFSPKKEEFKNKQKAINKGPDLELAVLFALNSMCESSPFRKPSQGYIYSIVDTQGRAQAAIEESNRKTALRNKVLKELPDEFVLAFAKGYRSRNKYTLNVLPDADAIEARFALSQELEKDADWLERQLSSSTVLLEGVVRDAHDKGRIRGNNAGNNQFVWNWQDGNEIATLDARRSGIDALVEYLITSGKDRDFLTKMNVYSRIDEYDKNTESPSAATAITEKDDVDLAISEGLITFEPSTSKVVTLERVLNDIQISSNGKTIRMIPEGENWVDFIKNDNAAKKKITNLVATFKNAQ